MNADAASARTLNRLIVACKDDITVFDAAARVVGDPTQKERLRIASVARVRFVGDLAMAVIGAGGVPSKHGSLRVAIATWLGRLKTVMGGKHDGDAYARCARVEAQTAELYADALRSPLQDDAHFGVLRQRAEVDRNRRELKWMRDLS
jgi:uncharacterized protein (TIGR02284 family)